MTIYIIFLLKNIMKVMVDTLTKRKIENPTPIQMQVIIHHESFLLFVCLYVFVQCFLSYYPLRIFFCPFYFSLSSFVLLSVLICPILSSSILYPYPVLILSGWIFCLVTSFVFCLIFCSFHQNPESKNVADQDRGGYYGSPLKMSPPPVKALRREKS